MIQTSWAAIVGRLSALVRGDWSLFQHNHSSTSTGGAISASTEHFAEFPAGTIDGINDTFTLVAAPNPPGSLILERNGITLTEGNDFTLAANVITFLAGAIPITGNLVVARRYLSL